MIRMIATDDTSYLCLGSYSDAVARTIEISLDMALLPCELKADHLFDKDPVDGYVRRINDGELAIVPKTGYPRYGLNLRTTVRMGNGFRKILSMRNTEMSSAALSIFAFICNALII